MSTSLREAVRLQREAVAELEVATLSRGRTNSGPLARARQVLSALESAAGTDPVLWEGETEGGTFRVRRLDAAALIVEKLLSRHWEATDDETAAQVYETAIISLVGDRGLPAAE